MPAITALLHTSNDAIRLGRALESLRPCDEILIVDHDSRDATLHIAREYGARILPFQSRAEAGWFLEDARHDWVLCLDPREALTEGLEASLYEWKSQSPSTDVPFSVFIREETPDAWIALPSPQTRLVPRSWTLWNGHLPSDYPSAIKLEGDLLRFLS
jgi:glycosyltransferase involved in cell wall biosynthesis